MEGQSYPHLYLTTHVTSSVHVTFWGSQKLRNSRARLQKLSGAQNNVIYHLSKNPKILSEIDSKRFNPLRSARAHVFVHALMSRKIVRGRDAQFNTEESLNVIRLTQTVALQHYVLVLLSFVEEPSNFALHSPLVH